MMFFRDLLVRYGAALADTWPLWVLAALLGTALVLPPVRRALARMPRLAQLALFALLAAGAVTWAWQLRWLCDDAYISFRYADNLARGHGLVFNPGERVEGYTNFLWTVVMAGFIKLGADPGQVAVVLGMALFVTLLYLLARLGERLSPASGAFGIAPLLAAASYTLASFATSGLETMFAATLALAAVERADARKPVIAGLLGVGAAMAHPDHGIFYAALGLTLLTFRDRRRELAFYALPFVLVYLPYFLWRWRYYGDLVPNTFHAKSADRLYFQQGSIYLLATFVGAGLWGVAPLAVIGAVKRWDRLPARFAVIALPLFATYVAKIGGDFMLGRLLTPAIAFSFLLADLGLRHLLEAGRARIALALLVPACVAALPTKVVRPGEKWWHLSDERTFYPLDTLSPLVLGSGFLQQGLSLKSAFVDRGLTPKLGLFCVGIVGYHARLPIFDYFGLTSREVARMPIPGRGRPGHEKIGTAGHGLHAGVVMGDVPIYPPPYAALTTIDVGGFVYHLSRYDQGLLGPVRGAATFTDFGGYLDQLAFLPQSERPDEVACDLWFYQSYYFAWNTDPERRERIVRRALAVDGSLRGVEPLLLASAPPEGLGYQRLRRLGFDAGEAWTATGEAFAVWPSHATTPGQSEVYGQEGPFANSFTAARDAARGVLRSAPFTVAGDVITLQVGGGRDPERARVSLVVDGQRVRSATGCYTEVMGRRGWNVADLRGKTAFIEIVDDTDEGWGHVLADEIVEWRAPPEPPGGPGEAAGQP